jgi:hypothetical protein
LRGFSRTTVKEKPLPKYKYRNYPCSITRNPWYVSGSSKVKDGDGYMDNGSGILEWCWDEDDAKRVFKTMSQYPQFSNLKIGQWVEEEEEE